MNTTIIKNGTPLFESGALEQSNSRNDVPNSDTPETIKTGFTAENGITSSSEVSAFIIFDISENSNSEIESY